MSKPKRKPVRPVGKSLGWTEFDIERLAQVTEEDKAAARAFWRRQAPRPLRKLLDAKLKQ